MKRIIILAAALVLAISLAACAGITTGTPDESTAPAADGTGTQPDNGIDTNADVGTETQANGDAVEKDSDGNITKLYHYDGDGSLVFIHEQVWKDGRIVRKTSYDKNGAQTASYEYKYDERGNNTESSWFFWNNGILMKVENEYDELGRKTGTTGYGNALVATNRSVFEYDDSHPNVYARRTYYPRYPGDEYFVSTYEYDDSDNLLKETVADKDGALSNYTVYTYADGRLAEYTNYDSEDSVNYTYKIVYDENGAKLREERYDANGNLEGVDNA